MNRVKCYLHRFTSSGKHRKDSNKKKHPQTSISLDPTLLDNNNNNSNHYNNNPDNNDDEDDNNSRVDDKLRGSHLRVCHSLDPSTLSDRHENCKLLKSIEAQVDCSLAHESNREERNNECINETTTAIPLDNKNITTKTTKEAAITTTEATMTTKKAATTATTTTFPDEINISKKFCDENVDIKNVDLDQLTEADYYNEIEVVEHVPMKLDEQGSKPDELGSKSDEPKTILIDFKQLVTTFVPATECSEVTDGYIHLNTCSSGKLANNTNINNDSNKDYYNFDDQSNNYLKVASESLSTSDTQAATALQPQLDTLSSCTLLNTVPPIPNHHHNHQNTKIIKQHLPPLPLPAKNKTTNTNFENLMTSQYILHGSLKMSSTKGKRSIEHLHPIRNSCNNISYNTSSPGGSRKISSNNSPHKKTNCANVVEDAGVQQFLNNDNFTTNIAEDRTFENHAAEKHMIDIYADSYYENLTNKSSVNNSSSSANKPEYYNYLKSPSSHQDNCGYNCGDDCCYDGEAANSSTNFSNHHLTQHLLKKSVPVPRSLRHKYHSYANEVKRPSSAHKNPQLQKAATVTGNYNDFCYSDDNFERGADPPIPSRRPQTSAVINNYNCCDQKPMLAPRVVRSSKEPTTFNHLSDLRPDEYFIKEKVSYLQLDLNPSTETQRSSLCSTASHHGNLGDVIQSRSKHECAMNYKEIDWLKTKALLETRNGRSKESTVSVI